MPESPLTHAVLASYHGRDLDNIVQANLNRVVADAHPSTSSVLAFFAFSHLPDHLRSVSRTFAITAVQVVDQAEGTKTGAELTTALRKLLEAKDCAVRAALSTPAVAGTPG